MSDVLNQLATTIAARRGADPAQSYTALLLGDPAKAAQKVGEEAVEVVIAAMQGDRAQLIYESADLVYHLIVLLTAHGVDLADIETELAHRQQKQ